MPAARHALPVLGMALAVIATIQGLPPGAGSRADRAGRLEPVDLRHLHVHEHDVVAAPRARASTASRPSATTSAR